MGKKQNNLTGKEWLQYSFSIWRDIEKNIDEKKLKHPAMFPIQLASKLINIFSKDDGEVILDPFLGSGTTLISSKILNKKGIGFELSEEYVELSKNRIEDIVSENDFEQKIYNKSIFKISNTIEENSVDLAITSPPYWNILNEKRTADNKEIRNYSDSEDDLGNVKDYEDFLNLLIKGFKEVHKVLKPNKYFIVNVMDIRKKSKFYPFHSDIISKMKEIGFELDDIIIWDRQKEYNNMRPLGYPYVFRVNKVHEFILIFIKREE